MSQPVAYLGPPGTFTEQAALQHSPDSQLTPYPNITAIAQAVTSGLAEEGLVPIENSLEGSVNDTLDALIQQKGLSICKELVIPIEHCLIAKPGTELSDIKVVYSHPQALGQCRSFLEQFMPNSQPVASLSTAAAVKDMNLSNIVSAAIAPQRAAELNDAEILQTNILGNSTNKTRFVVLAVKDSGPTGRDKTSLCFSFSGDSPGLLYNVLGEFYKRDINLAKVESRPSKQSLGEYIFLIDIHGHREDPRVKDAIDGLAQQASALKVFGSYPRWIQGEPA